MNFKSAVVLGLSVGLAACSTMPEKPLQEYRLSEIRALQQLDNWKLEGRLSLVDERDSVAASIAWRHTPDADNIELSGPLAQGRVLVVILPGQVVVDQGEGPQVYAGTADEVFARQMGVDMPVAALRYWVLGLNDPARPYIERSSGFIQDGWSILYKEMQDVDARLLPKKIMGEKSKTRIKLIIDQWVLS